MGGLGSWGVSFEGWWSVGCGVWVVRYGWSRVVGCEL